VARDGAAYRWVPEPLALGFLRPQPRALPPGLSTGPMGSRCGTRTKRTRAVSLYHLVGAREQRRLVAPFPLMELHRKSASRAGEQDTRADGIGQ
jgi:hypothetical protein